MKRIILTLTAMFSLVTLAHAQFGSGVVFDPTQSGHAVVQIEHEEQSLANQAQQIENGQQVYTNTVKIAATCQGRSKTRPVGRSKSRPVVGRQVVE
jgi:hypothetical protein